MRIEIPGKLFISGEYAVLYGAHAVLAPVERSMTFECVRASRNTFASSVYGKLDLDNDPSVPKAIHQAYRVALDYLRLQGIPLRHFIVRVQSTLFHQGVKLGLGSSGALSVGIIRSIVAFHGVKIEKGTLYKLSVLSQKHSLRHASFADIAVAVYGTWILYRRFDGTWFNRQSGLSLEHLLKQPWPKLLIKPFNPGALNAFAVNSLKPASSKALVEAFMKNFDEVKNVSLIDTVDQLSLTLYNELRDHKHCTHTVCALNRAYENLIKAASLDLKPEPLGSLMETIEALVGASKLSGAGGGDCVLAFFDDAHSFKEALNHFARTKYPCIHFRRTL